LGDIDYHFVVFGGRTGKHMVRVALYVMKKSYQYDGDSLAKVSVPFIYK
jgi:hypothetical protein